MAWRSVSAMAAALGAIKENQRNQAASATKISTISIMRAFSLPHFRRHGWRSMWRAALASCA
ncbi:hypothetical protein AVEN_51838-1, partial [Araneus ventricosus]